MEEVRLNVRVPKDLYEWLKMFAEDQGRSMNAQIVQTLKEERARQQAAKQVPPTVPADNDRV